jgi:Icc-related predicted phosphoesterase|nr:metallophosphoesterase [Neorhizobium tomejilense]
MDIWHISDLHMGKEEAEGGIAFGEIPKADVAVIIGDLSSDMMANLRWCAKVVRPHMPVVYVPGNHDFHFRGIIQASAEGRKYASRLGIHYLDGDAAVVAGVRFVGGTFWSDFAVDVYQDGRSPEAVVKANMDASLGKADFKRIMHCEKVGEVLKPWHTAAIHDRTKGFIRRTLSRAYREGPTVVVTHHGPLPDVSQPGFENSTTHASYTSDQSSMMKGYAPEMWLFGHIHNAFNRTVGKTKVWCNPRGRVHEDTGFDWGLVHAL